jgi:hypothetical protein
LKEDLPSSAASFSNFSMVRCDKTKTVSQDVRSREDEWRKRSWRDRCPVTRPRGKGKRKTATKAQAKQAHLVDTTALVDQVTGSGGLSGVDVTDNDDVDVSLFLTLFAMERNSVSGLVGGEWQEDEVTRWRWLMGFFSRDVDVARGHDVEHRLKPPPSSTFRFEVASRGASSTAW